MVGRVVYLGGRLLSGGVAGWAGKAGIEAEVLSLMLLISITHGGIGGVPGGERGVTFERPQKAGD